MSTRADSLFSKPCRLQAAVTKGGLLPNTRHAEVAFVGRSNVGKSSLINLLLGLHNMARVSNTPGRTQQLFFFNVGDALMLVDMPGYGYAKASRKEARSWTGLIRDYLRERPQLKRVFLLIDSRHGVKSSDVQMMDLLDEAAVIYQLVLTKSDKVKKTDLEAVQQEAKELIKTRSAAFPELITSSTIYKDGLDLLRATIMHIVKGS